MKIAYVQDLPYAWRFSYLNGKAIDLIGSSQFSSDHRKPTNPGLYLASINNEPAIIAVNHGLYVNSLVAHIALLRDYPNVNDLLEWYTD